jgi:hypothetical protein
MITLHILTPYDKRHEVDEMEAEDFKIISSHKNRSHLSRLFTVVTTEDYAIMLTLKYGRDNVWKR